MTNLRQAAEMALEALEWSYGGEPMPTKELAAINAIRQALAEWTPDDTAYRPDGLSQDMEPETEEPLTPEEELEAQQQQETHLDGVYQRNNQAFLAQANLVKDELPPVKSYCGGKPNYCEPEMPVDRGAWSDVPDATKWVDELRGDEPKREWQWLTEEDIHDLFMSNETVDDFGDFETIACAVSTKLKGKNNG